MLYPTAGAGPPFTGGGLSRTPKWCQYCFGCPNSMVIFEIVASEHNNAPSFQKTWCMFVPCCTSSGQKSN